MDAPKGRYRVEEKDGRLTVIDTLTGAPAAQAGPTPGFKQASPRRPGAMSGPPGLLDRYGRRLIGLVASKWDEEGKAVIAWEWEQNGRTERWDAALGPAEQKRLGRALAAVSVLPALLLVAIFLGPAAIWWLALLALPAVFWGVLGVIRLQRETTGR